MSRRKAAAVEGRATDSTKFRMEIKGLAYLFVAAFLFLCVFSFHPDDPTFNQAVSATWKTSNLAGTVGSYIAGFLVELFGVGAIAWPLLLAYLGLAQFSDKLRLPWYRWTGLALVILSLMIWVTRPWAATLVSTKPALTSGGLIGKSLAGMTLTSMGPWGAVLFWLFLSVASVQVGFQVSWASVFKRLKSFLFDQWCKYRERILRRRAVEGKPKAEAAAASVPTPRKVEPKPFAGPAAAGDSLVLKPFEAPAPARKASAQPLWAAHADLPSAELLREAPPQLTVADPKILQAKARQLTACLADFNIQGEIQQVLPGPVVTMFEFKPAPGVKISTIAARNDDIALSLKALAVRIEAPIPGKDSIGVEIPNEKRQTVSLREIIESPVFSMARSPLALALGKDIQGAPQIADLATMPHLLVAGATGAGKSVCLNGFLVSILFKATPEQVKLLLIDPKRIELAIYSDLPHLVHPVVTDMNLAKSALEWAMCEMDSRYETLARLGVRNIEGYNQKLAEMGDRRPEEFSDLAPLPYLVIVIDELADLMMTSAKDVETCIVRLAQLARAAGIHMILATQRPSVDVVTGLIKANFPTRISFQVTSRHDSRTILDTVGAERLLGKGDMLYKSGGAKLRRLHGAYVDEAEIEAVVAHWKARQPQQFELDFSEWRKDGEAAGVGGAQGGGESSTADDPMYAEAVEFVMSQGRASISLIQRRFRIGFNRAARYIEQMEADGLLGGADGSKPRVVIKGRE
ncbi:MAG: DNA translocase FtsK 4TM domain-containing protein [Proteobacteria bacterium]|nr:DNA translocase FtsK 4TM domain-containing protein [Pseudomonadota bacterium]MBU1596466.1 DNA translocase FtsK 4TM domain-containing protein [Pseudomonadota bacterium]